MTWRELVDEILKHPELLDETAYVWTPDSGIPHDDFAEVTGITPYDADAPADGENFLSINLRNW